MLLISHAAAGAAVASVIPNPVFYIPISFASHFVLDAVPHYHLKDESKNLYCQTAVDVVLSIMFLVFVYKFTNNISLVWGGLTASIMDLDAFFYYPGLGKYGKVTKKIFPDFISKIHGKCQNETEEKLLGVVTQVGIILIAITLMMINQS